MQLLVLQSAEAGLRMLLGESHPILSACDLCVVWRCGRVGVTGALSVTASTVTVRPLLTETLIITREKMII